MKLKLWLLSLLLCVFSASAQDIITLTDGTSIKAKVEEITDSAIKYRKHTNPTGPVYTVKLHNVSTIVYDNGETDVFNTHADESSSTADDKSHSPAAQPNTSLNEAELLRIATLTDLGVYDNTTYDAASYHAKKAKTYRRIAWIGGSIIAAAGIGIGLALGDSESDSYYYMIYCGAPAVAGAIWCVSWNLAANRQKKKAKMAEAYSVPVIQGEMLRIGNHSLMGSVNVMGDNLTRTHAVGLGLSYNF